MDAQQFPERIGSQPTMTSTIFCFILNLESLWHGISLCPVCVNCPSSHPATVNWVYSESTHTGCQGGKRESPGALWTQFWQPKRWSFFTALQPQMKNNIVWLLWRMLTPSQPSSWQGRSFTLCIHHLIYLATWKDHNLSYSPV